MNFFHLVSSHGAKGEKLAIATYKVALTYSIVYLNTQEIQLFYNQTYLTVKCLPTAIITIVSFCASVKDFASQY